MSNLNPRWLIGKTIASVKMNPFKARAFGNNLAHDPVIQFTDGSYITFTVEETDFGVYGVDVVYWPKAKRAAKAEGAPDEADMP